MTTPLTVSLDGDGAFADLTERPLHGMVERVAFLRHGTKAGNGSLALLIRLDDGRFVMAETTYRLAYTAARTIAASPAVAEEVL